MSHKGERRHRWGLNLWVTDAEEAKIRTHFTRRLESLAEAARRLLLTEINEVPMDKPITREIADALRDYQQVKHLLNGDTFQLGGEDTPVTSRLLEFLQQRQVLADFNQGRPRL
jgi:hypothetical protein